MAIADPDVSERDQAAEALAPSVVEALVRGEVDIQIATANRYPRSLEQFQRRAISMATLDEDTAESCLYRRPVGKKNGKEEYAEGLSIRMAEIVGACYGNLRVGCQLIEQTPEFVRARGMAIDLETNFASSSEVIESTLKNKYDRGGAIVGQEPMSARMRIVIAKAALSKARRDATFQVVPKALAKPIEVAVRGILLGTAETLEKRRQRLAAWIGKLGIAETRVYAAIGVAGPADLTAEKLEVLTGIRTAIHDNEIAIDEAFPPLEGPQPAQRKSEHASAQMPPAPVASAEVPPSPSEPGDPSASNGQAESRAPVAPATGTVAVVDARQGGTLIKLDTGFQAATRDEALIRAATMAKASGLRVTLATRPAKVQGNVPILTAVTRAEAQA